MGIFTCANVRESSHAGSLRESQMKHSTCLRQELGSASMSKINARRCEMIKNKENFIIIEIDIISRRRCCCYSRDHNHSLSIEITKTISLSHARNNLGNINIVVVWQVPFIRSDSESIRIWNNWTRTCARKRREEEEKEKLGKPLPPYVVKN